MKKRNFLRAVVLIALTLSLMASSIVFVSADGTVADGTVLLNEDMLAGKDLSSMFTITNGGSVEYKDGALNFTAGTSAINCFDLSGMNLGLSKEITSYTLMGDFKFTSFATNIRFAMGVRARSNVNAKNHDYFTGLNAAVASSKYITMTATNHGDGVAGNSQGTTYSNHVLFPTTTTIPSNTVSCKIVVTNNIPTFYMSVAGSDWEEVPQKSAGKACNKSGEDNVVFFSLRNGQSATLDNLVVYAGTGEAPDASPATTAPWGLGYQLSDVYQGANGNVANIRFIALGTDMDVENVGFKVTADVEGKSWDRNTSTVYTELWGKNAAGVDGAVAKASDYGADFIYGLAIKGIPTDTDITFTVTPYATKNGEIVEGATFRVVVNVPSNTAS